MFGGLVDAQRVTAPFIISDNRTSLYSSRGLTLASGRGIHFNGTANWWQTPDLVLERDAANTLAQRNGTNAQAFNIYNTYTDASNYERGTLKWDTNEFVVGTEAAGTGTKRDLKVNTNTFVDGDLTFASDGAGGNWLKFYRQQSNYWRLASSGVGDVFKVQGNLITFPQNVLIQRGGLEVQNTLHNASAAEPFKGNITFDDAQQHLRPLS